VKIGGLWLAAMFVEGDQPLSWPSGPTPSSCTSAWLLPISMLRSPKLSDWGVDDASASSASVADMGGCAGARPGGAGPLARFAGSAGHPLCLSTQIPE